MTNVIKTFGITANASLKTMGAGIARASVKTWNGKDAVAASYLPSDNPTSLIAWFRTGVGITESGGFASAWADQSGNGNNLLQATGTNQPAYSAGVLTFDGIDNFMATAGFTFTQPGQLSILVNMVSWTSARYMTDGDSSEDDFALQQSGSTPNVRLVAGNAASSLATTQITVGSYHVVSAMFNGASSSIKVDSNSVITGTVTSGGIGGFALGSRGAGGLNTNIEVKEIILRNVNDATIRANDH